MNPGPKPESLGLRLPTPALVVTMRSDPAVASGLRPATADVVANKIKAVGGIARCSDEL